MPDLLPDPAAAAANLLAVGWALDSEHKALERDYRFADFATAFAWMTRVALAAERLNHHPDWSNRYNRVRVRLTTHDAGGLTERDLLLARIMEEAPR